MITLLEALKQAAAYSINPVYSLFSCTSTGSYTLILKTSKPEEIVSRFKEAAANPAPFAVGLEVRCNGSRVNFDRAD